MWRSRAPFPRKYSKIRRPTITIHRPKRSFIVYLWIIGWCTIFVLLYGYYIAVEVPKTYKLPKEIEKRVYETISKLEDLAEKTEYLEEYRSITEEKRNYLNFVGNPAYGIYKKILEDKSKDWKLRFLIIEVLSTLDGYVVKDSLLRILEDKEEYIELRQAAALALGLVKAEGAENILKKIINNQVEYPKELRKTAKVALSYLK